MGAFHSTKTFENLETAVNGTEISWKSFHKFQKLLIFRNANHSTENFRNSGSKVEWKENFRENFLENLGIYLARLSSFLEMSENRHYRCSQPKNAVPFATGSCRKFKPEVLVEWKAPNVCTLLDSILCICYVNLNCKYTAKNRLQFISHLLAHGAVRKIAEILVSEFFWSIISMPKELQGDCKALGSHKTVKQAPLKTTRQREQGFDVHHCWINGNYTSRNIHSITGNFSTTYQVFIS